MVAAGRGGGATGSGEELYPPRTLAVMEATWMLSGGYRRQRVYGAPESRPQGGVGGRRRVILAHGDSGPPLMASSAPRASLPSPHPGGSRDGKEKGADGGDTEFHPQSQPGWPRSGWGRVSILVLRRSPQAASWRPLRDRPHFPSRASSASVCPRLARQHLKAPDVRVISRPRAGAKQCVPSKECSWVLAIKWGCG